MRSFTDHSSLDSCPASPVIQAVRAAATPLAIADAHASGAPILFANEAFVALVGQDAQALIGRPLVALASPALERLSVGATDRFELALPGGRTTPVALSTAVVTGPQDKPFCLLCSLVEVSRTDSHAGPASDVELLAQVASAASQLVREPTVAAGGSEAPRDGA